MKAPPPHVQAAARVLSDWMAQEGHDDWMLNGCASAKTVIRMEREIESYHLRMVNEEIRQQRRVQLAQELLTDLSRPQ